MDVGKRCGVCGELKPISHFSRYRRGYERRRYLCKECANLQKSKWVVGMGIEEYREYERKQELYGKSRDRRRSERLAVENEELRELVSASIHYLMGFGLTQVEIARQAGVDRGSVAKYARGGETKYVHRKLASKILGLADEYRNRSRV